ncbi:MAG: hypothetical protein AseanaTS_21090 [Candidatus Pelagadaptatus aseana]|uniref:chemotaxis protein CheA n=1 Tax=Candidatus Pelagadaptatus aseana TaxID=3120508 RepID=UPI0039B2C9FC
MSIDLSQFHQVFFEESFEGLDAMETALMELDPSDIDSETINTIFRAAHSIKGGSATFGFSIVAEFTHVLETLLDEVRAGNRGISQDDVDLFLQSVDCLRELLTALQAEEEPDSQQSETLKTAFEAILNGETPAPADTPDTAAESEMVLAEPASTDDDTTVWNIRFIPYRDVLRTGNEPLRMFRELSDLGEVKVQALVDGVPAFPQMEPEACYLGWQISCTGNASRADIEEVFEWVADESEIVISEGAASDSQGQSSAAAGNDWCIQFKPNADILRTGNEPLRIFRELADAGQIRAEVDVSNVPAWSQLDSEACYLSWSLQLSEAATREQIDEAFEWVADESDILIQAGESEVEQQTVDASAVETEAPVNQPPEEPVVAEVPEPTEIQSQPVEVKPPADPKPVQAPTPAKPAAKKASTESSSIRVGIDKIDSLINMVGELVITQSMLGQLGTDFEMSHMPKLLEGLSQLEQNTRELQESVMRIRMLPISFAFNRFPRMVRDLSRRLNKNIDLVLVGEQTELDKTVMEKIGDPLVHLVRNSVDHGIESPQERLAAGKSETGEIVLNAYHQGGNVVIEITDDGKGLNREKLLSKAIENGLVAESDAAAMSDDQVHDLIFQPGFSTAKEVSDVSGRGVGMDVVRRNIQELNGSVEITSKEGQGSRITIRLPLTLAILDGQLVRVGTHTYIFPLVSVVESMQNHQDMMSNVAGSCDVFKLRDEYVPVIRLFEIFGIEPDNQMVDDSLLVVVECDGEKVGIVVDELEAQQQVVIKSLEQNYRRVEGISGATILGDGTVALILDIPGLVKLAGINHQMRSRVMNLAGSHQSVQHMA